MLRLVDIDSCVGFLPWALLHDSGAERTYSAQDLADWAEVTSTADFVEACLRAVAPPVTVIGERARMQALGGGLCELGRWPLATFGRFVSAEVMRTRLGWIAELEAQLEEHRGQPVFWAVEVARLIERSVAALISGQALRPALGDERLQRLIGRYGRLLAAWPDIRDAVIALRARAPALFALDAV